MDVSSAQKGGAAKPATARRSLGAKWVITVLIADKLYAELITDK